MQNRYAALGTALILLSPLYSQKVSIDAAVRASDKSYVLATGEATISAKPDQASINIGVITQGATAVSAAAQNAKQTDAVLADLHKTLAAADQVKTTGYAVRPNYSIPKAGATQTIAGYTAANTVEVTLNDLAEVGKVIDSALQSGANNIQKMEFGLKNPQTVRSQALREAAVQAKASAEAIAAGLGVQIVRVLSAEEYQPDDTFVRQKAAAPVPVAGAPPTPIEAGTIEVTVTVMLRVEVTQ